MTHVSKLARAIAVTTLLATAGVVSPAFAADDAKGSSWMCTNLGMFCDGDMKADKADKAAPGSEAGAPASATDAAAPAVTTAEPAASAEAPMKPAEMVAPASDAAAAPAADAAAAPGSDAAAPATTP